MLLFEDLKERDCLEDLSLDVEIKLKWILKKERKKESVDYIHLTQEWNRWEFFEDGN